MGWWIAAIVVWLASASCIIGTLYGIATGKKRTLEPKNLGAYLFHGSTAVLALWLFAKALA